MTGKKAEATKVAVVEPRQSKGKRTAITSLQAMMHTRLFCDGSWLADRDACIAMDAQLTDLGLQIELGEGSSQATALGKEVQVDLVMAFVGLWDEWEVPYVLEQYGLIDESDELHLYNQLEDCNDPEHVLRPWVRKAYFDHFNPSGRIN